MEKLLHYIGFDNDFLDMTAKSQETEGKKRQIGLHEKFLKIMHQKIISTE